MSRDFGMTDIRLHLEGKVGFETLPKRSDEVDSKNEPLPKSSSSTAYRLRLRSPFPYLGEG